MASSRKKRSERKRQEESQMSSAERRDKRKKSSGGCYKRKSKKGTYDDDKYNDSVDHANHQQHSRSNQNIENNSSSAGNINHQQGTKEVYRGNTDRNEFNRDHNDYTDSHYPTTVVDSIRDPNPSSSSYRYQGYGSNDVTVGNQLRTGDRNDSGDVIDVYEKRVITRNIDDRMTKNSNTNALAVNKPFGKTVTHAQVERQRRASIISKVTSSFSSGSSYKNKSTNVIQSNSMTISSKGKTSAANVAVKNYSGNDSHVTVEKSAYNSMDNSKLAYNDKGSIPVLKTNKSYKISFAMSSKDFVEGVPASVMTSSEVKTAESMHSRNTKELRRTKSSKRIQTEEGYFRDGGQKEEGTFATLMRDVHISDRNLLNTGQSMEAWNKASAPAGNSHDQNHSFMGQSTNAWNSGSGQNNNNNDNVDSIYVAEDSVYKEWFIIENADGKQEKREYKREVTADGDTNYVDLINGKILKTEKAEWKNGEELVKKKNGTKKVRYEWRKEEGTNEWVKYDYDTNEVLKRGDWKSGSEWKRNSKGKFIQTNYTYKKGTDGRWIKFNSDSGMIIDYSNCTALKGHNWVPDKRSGKNKKWKKQQYEYVQNDKGKWLKQDPETKRKLGKPSKTGWKEGKAYSMDKNNKVKKVKYIWKSENSGMMNQLNKKTKEPINTSWMAGREAIMNDNKVVTNNYSWVKNGKNKWVKIDEDGRPLTKNIKTNKIPSTNQMTYPNNAAATQRTKKLEKDRIVEESTNIEQKDGMVIRNTNKTIKY